MKHENTYHKLDIPDAAVQTFVVIAAVLLASPYMGGADFGIFKIPHFPAPLAHALQWLGPAIFVLVISGFIPLWPDNAANASDLLAEDNNMARAPNAVGKTSKYLLQSTPDIILNELLKNNINTGGFKIVAGVNVHDLKTRIRILNPQMSREQIDQLVDAARETAFSRKYAAPREDEKLEVPMHFDAAGIQPWHVYLLDFLKRLGLDDIENSEIIDVGIGNAYASQAFLTKCKNLTGVDVSRDALRYAEDKLPGAILIVGSAENLSKINSFSKDLYLSFRTYQSTLFDIKEALHEAYRVLAVGGGLIVSIPIMFLQKNDANAIVGLLSGLIPPGSSVPSLDYANQIVSRIAGYLQVLGFARTEICRDSPFEIFIGARK